MDSVKIGQFIAKLRNEQNMTQTELAKRLNVSNKTVSKWENGRGSPDTEFLYELSKEFNISVDELINGEKNTYNLNNKSYINKDNKKNKESLQMITVIFSIIFIAIIVLMIIILSNWFYPFMIITIFFGICLLISIIYHKDISIKYLWTFWKYVYPCLLIISIFATYLVNYNLKLYWGKSLYWGNNYNIIPFKGITKIINIYLSGAQSFDFIKDYILIKIYIIVPYPIISFFLNKEIRFNRCLLFILCFSIIKEFIQKIIGVGCFDIDDIMLNILGLVIGYFIVLILKYIIFKNRKEV